MTYYKKYRIIQNMELADNINHLIHFFHHLPLIKKFTNDKYKAYGLKKFVYRLGPFFSFLIQIVKSAFSFYLSMVIAGFVLWLFHINFNFAQRPSQEFFSLASKNLAFLTFYLGQAMISDRINGNKNMIHKLNSTLKLRPKETAIIYGVFEPLHLAIGRSVTFCVYFSLWKGLLLSFIIAFLLVIASAINLFIASKRSKSLSDSIIFMIIVFVALFATLMRFQSLDISIVIGTFIILLLGFCLSLRFIFNFDHYDRLLEVSKREITNIDSDTDALVNKSLALKDSDLKKSKSSTARGYQRLNDLFFARHKRLIAGPIYRKAAIILTLGLVGVLLINLVYKDFLKKL